MSREKLFWKKNELRWLRPVVLPNRHIHLCLFKLGYDVLALLSDVMYILSGENLAGVYSTTWRLRDQNTAQVDNRQGRAGTLCIRFAPSSSMGQTISFLGIHKSEQHMYIGFSPALHLQCTSRKEGRRCLFAMLVWYWIQRHGLGNGVGECLGGGGGWKRKSQLDGRNG